MWFSKYLKVFTGNKKGNVTEITGKVQTYDWGKWGRYSKVAELYKNANADFTINDDTPYAELWFGTHVSAPSGVKNEEKTLSSLIKENPRCLGEKIKERFGKEELPFLLKVLSIEKALSIQVHPDKASAERLHSQFPDIYKDANHKPEIAVALTPFEALCGFRPYAEIKKFFEVIPELQDLVGKGLCNQFESTSGDGEKSALKNCFHSMMTKPPEVIAALLESFLDRTKKLSI